MISSERELKVGEMKCRQKLDAVEVFPHFSIIPEVTSKTALDAIINGTLLTQNDPLKLSGLTRSYLGHNFCKFTCFSVELAKAIFVMPS
jgi:hypothetical protein